MPPKCTNSTCPRGWEAKCLPICQPGAFSWMRTATMVRNGWVIGWPMNLDTWRPIVPRKRTLKEQPWNTGSDCKNYELAVPKGKRWWGLDELMIIVRPRFLHSLLAALDRKSVLEERSGAW